MSTARFMTGDSHGYQVPQPSCGTTSMVASAHLRQRRRQGPCAALRVPTGRPSGPPLTPAWRTRSLAPSTSSLTAGPSS